MTVQVFIAVGDRVLTADARDTAIHPTTVDPATWRKLTLRADVRWPDGTVDDSHVETLQPLSWLRQHNVAVGRICPVPLDLREMDVPPDTPFVVTAIEPAPHPQTAPGRVVLTTINHLKPRPRRHPYAARHRRRQRHHRNVRRAAVEPRLLTQ